MDRVYYHDVSPAASAVDLFRIWFVTTGAVSRYVSTGIKVSVYIRIFWFQRLYLQAFVFQCELIFSYTCIYLHMYIYLYCGFSVYINWYSGFCVSLLSLGDAWRFWGFAAVAGGEDYEDARSSEHR